MEHNNGLPDSHRTQSPSNEHYTGTASSRSSSPASPVGIISFDEFNALMASVNERPDAFRIVQRHGGSDPQVSETPDNPILNTNGDSENNSNSQLTEAHRIADAMDIDDENDEEDDEDYVDPGSEDESSDSQEDAEFLFMNTVAGGALGALGAIAGFTAAVQGFPPPVHEIDYFHVNASDALPACQPAFEYTKSLKDDDTLKLDFIGSTRLVIDGPDGQLPIFRDNIGSASYTSDIFFLGSRAKLLCFECDAVTGLPYQRPSLSVQVQPSLTTMEQRDNAVWPVEPHNVNFVKTGFLADREVVVSLGDDGRAIVWLVQDFIDRLSPSPSSSSPPGPIEPLVVLQNESSAWGVDFHSRLGLLAVSDNSRRVTIYDLSYLFPRDGTAPIHGANASRIPRIRSPLMGHNVPDVEFVGDDDSDDDDEHNGSKNDDNNRKDKHGKTFSLACISISGHVAYWEFSFDKLDFREEHNPESQERVFSHGKWLYEEDLEEDGWTITFLGPRDFKQVPSLKLATGDKWIEDCPTFRLIEAQNRQVWGDKAYNNIIELQQRKPYLPKYTNYPMARFATYDIPTYPIHIISQEDSSASLSSLSNSPATFPAGGAHPSRSPGALSNISISDEGVPFLTHQHPARQDPEFAQFKLPGNIDRDKKSREYVEKYFPAAAANAVSAKAGNSADGATAYPLSSSATSASTSSPASASSSQLAPPPPPPDRFFVCTTKKGLFLCRAEDCYCNASRTNVFGWQAISDETHFDRLSISKVIRPLSAMVVVSQMGIISIFRLTKCNGVYAMRQEYIFPKVKKFLFLSEHRLRPIAAVTVAPVQSSMATDYFSHCRFRLNIIYLDGLVLTYEISRQTDDDDAGFIL